MSIKKFIPIAVMIVFALSLSCAFAKPSDEEVNVIFSSAESLFKAMKEKNYPAIWQSLTAKTKQSTIEAVYKSLQKDHVNLEKEKIGADFADGGALAKAYWNSYLNAFDPDTVLEQSKWDVGAMKKDKAEINILYKKSEKPAVLLLYMEGNVWKVGLEETFSPRNLLPY